jgi:hypothetical protein
MLAMHLHHGPAENEGGRSEDYEYRIDQGSLLA